MAPEQTRGDSIDFRADLFSLGSVLYTLTSGRPPFRATNTIAVLHRVHNDIPRPIQEIIPETPTWLCDIISKLHAKEPADRFSSARELAEVMEDCLSQLQRDGRVLNQARIPSPPIAVAKIPERPTRRWLGWLKLVAALLLLPVLALTGTELAGLTHLLSRSAVKPTVPEGTTTVSVPNPLPVEKDLTTHTDPSTGMKFILVRKGKGWFGGSNGDLDPREENLEYDFYMGVYEVTQGEWIALMGEANNPSHFSRFGEKKAEVADLKELLNFFPVERVSWNQAQEFVKRLNTKAKETGWKYRLPTLLK